MSAIFGLLFRDGTPAAPSLLDAMGQALAAHGPDGLGSWQQGPVALGHRLSCFTPEDRFEQQPCIGAGGQQVLVSDGRIDNRPELAAAFGWSSVEVSTLPDSRFIAQAYEKWGEGCASRLVGSFAFALWDAQRACLFAARSPFYGAPFHYYEDARVFAFASRPKGLFALPFLQRRIDPEYLADYMTSMPADFGRTFYRGIHTLERGHSLRVWQGGLELRPHWRLEDVPAIRFARDDDYLDAFRALFDRVIADQLRSITPVSVMMSGGLDSTAVAGTAAQLLSASGRLLPTFTEVPGEGWEGTPAEPGRYLDEAPYAQLMARQHPNLRPRFVQGGGYYLDGIKSLFEAAEVPFRNAANRAWWEACLRDSGQQGARVVLTGIGGNLTVGWSGQALITELLREGQWFEAGRAARAMAQSGMHRSAFHALVSGGLPLLPIGWQSLIRRRRRGGPWRAAPAPWAHYSAISQELAQQSRLAQRTREKRLNFNFISASSSLARRVSSLRQVEAGLELARGHRAMYGIDLRHPVCDQRLVEFSLGIPESQHCHHGLPRALFRRGMRDRVPAEILDNRSRGRQGARWLARLNDAKGKVGEELESMARSPLVQASLDVPRLCALFDRLPPVGAESATVKFEYRVVFESGLMTGRFLRWVESGD